MQPIWKTTLYLIFLYLCWLLMMLVHEGGHCLHAWLSGGHVARVVIPAIGFSYTELSYNPRPLFVAWGGAIWGNLVPLALFGLAAAARRRGIGWIQFFAGFCLIANGVYIGVGSIGGLADAGDMLRHGSARWQLVVFGLLATPLGLYLWHGLGPKFGLGEARGAVSRPATIVSLALLAILVAAEMIVGSR